MIASILLGVEEDAIASQEIERRVLEWRQRAVHVRSAVPDFVSLAGCIIGDPDSPWPGPQGDQWQAILCATSTDEDELLAVERPVRMQIAISAGSDVVNALGRDVIDNDQAVVATIGDEGDVLAIGRPLRLSFISAQLEGTGDGAK